MEYSLLDLISMLDEVVRKAAPVPFSKKSLVDASEIDEIATEMRLVLPREIQQAQNIVADKNRIISDAKKEAEEIIRKAEQQRSALIDQNSILQEARRRATEEIGAAQKRSALIRSSTQDFTDKMLQRHGITAEAAASAAGSGAAARAAEKVTQNAETPGSPKTAGGIFI